MFGDAISAEKIVLRSTIRDDRSSWLRRIDRSHSWVNCFFFN